MSETIWGIITGVIASALYVACPDQRVFEGVSLFLFVMIVFQLLGINDNLRIDCQHLMDIHECPPCDENYSGWESRTPDLQPFTRTDADRIRIIRMNIEEEYQVCKLKSENVNDTPGERNYYAGARWAFQSILNLIDREVAS